MKKIFLAAVCLFVAGSLFAGTTISDSNFVPTKNNNWKLGSVTNPWAIVYSSAAAIKRAVSMVDEYTNLAAATTIHYQITIATHAFDTAYFSTGVHLAGLTQVRHDARDFRVSFETMFASNIAHCDVTWTYVDARGNSWTESTTSSITLTQSTLSNRGMLRITKVVLSNLTVPQSSYEWRLRGYGDSEHSGGIPVNVGFGDKVGLRGDIELTSDGYCAKVQTSSTWADETASVTFNAIYDTWTHSDVPDAADDFEIFYRANTEIR